MADRTLSEQEMIEILEQIARNAQNAAARIAAIKTLREMGCEEEAPQGGFEALDELAPRRNRAKR